MSRTQKRLRSTAILSLLLVSPTFIGGCGSQTSGKNPTDDGERSADTSQHNFLNIYSSPSMLSFPEDDPGPCLSRKLFETDENGNARTDRPPIAREVLLNDYLDPLDGSGTIDRIPFSMDTRRSGFSEAWARLSGGKPEPVAYVDNMTFLEAQQYMNAFIQSADVVCDAVNTVFFRMKIEKDGQLARFGLINHNRWGVMKNAEVRVYHVKDPGGNESLEPVPFTLSSSRSLVYDAVTVAVSSTRAAGLAGTLLNKMGLGRVVTFFKGVGKWISGVLNLPILRWFTWPIRWLTTPKGRKAVAGGVIVNHAGQSVMVPSHTWGRFSPGEAQIATIIAPAGDYIFAVREPSFYDDFVGLVGMPQWLGEQVNAAVWNVPGLRWHKEFEYQAFFSIQDAKTGMTCNDLAGFQFKKEGAYFWDTSIDYWFCGESSFCHGQVRSGEGVVSDCNKVALRHEARPDGTFGKHLCSAITDPAQCTREGVLGFGCMHNGTECVDNTNAITLEEYAEQQADFIAEAEPDATAVPTPTDLPPPAVKTVVLQPAIGLTLGSSKSHNLGGHVVVFASSGNNGQVYEDDIDLSDVTGMGEASLTVEWSTSDSDVVDVDDNGKLTASANITGTADITATVSRDGNPLGDAVITVTVE